MNQRAGLFLSLCVLGMAGCQRDAGSKRSGLSGDPALPDCGFQVATAPNSPPLDACLDGSVIAGPVTYPRTAGSPQSEVLPFSVAQPGTVCVRVSSGSGDRDTRLASATIDVDGTMVVPTSWFNPGVEALEARHAVEPGEHVARTRIASQPGRSLTLDLRFATATLAGATPASGETAVIDVFGLHAAPPTFFPDGDAIPDETELSVIVAFHPPVPGDAGQRTFALEARFEIASADTCLPTIELSTSVDLETPVTARLALSWDGRDRDGLRVSDGRYFYRAVVDLFGVNPNGSRVRLDGAVSAIQALQVGVVIDVPPPPLSPTTAPRLGGRFIRELPGIQTVPLDPDEDAAERAAVEANLAAQNHVPTWFARYREAAAAEPSLALVSELADDGPVAGEHLWQSRWTVRELLAGPALPSVVTLRQRAPGGSQPSDGMLRGRNGLAFVAILQPGGDGTFRLIHDTVTGTYSFGYPVGTERWQFETGPELGRTDLNNAAEAW